MKTKISILSALGIVLASAICLVSCTKKASTDNPDPKGGDAKGSFTLSYTPKADILDVADIYLDVVINGETFKHVAITDKFSISVNEEFDLPAEGIIKITCTKKAEIPEKAEFDLGYECKVTIGKNFADEASFDSQGVMAEYIGEALSNELYNPSWSISLDKDGYCPVPE